MDLSTICGFWELKIICGWIMAKTLSSVDQLQTSTVSACLDIKMNSKTIDCRCYEPSQTVIVATWKVSPGSEYAPEGPTAKRNLPLSTHTGPHTHNTRSSK